MGCGVSREEGVGKTSDLFSSVVDVEDDEEAPIIVAFWGDTLVPKYLKCEKIKFQIKKY